MSVDLYVIMASDRAPTTEVWQSAIKARSLPIVFDKDFDALTSTGFVPVIFDGRKSGFEFYLSETKDLDLSNATPGKDLPEPSVAYLFNFSSVGYECASALYAATVLVADFGGLAFDPQRQEWTEPSVLSDSAAECLRFAQDHVEHKTPTPK